MSPGSNTESYPAFAHIGLRESSGKNLNQITCPDRESNPVFTCYNDNNISLDGLQNVNRSDSKDKESVHSFRSNTDAKSSDQYSIQSHFRPPRVFETSTEKKEMLQHIARKVQMQYSLKVKHSLVPVLVNDDYKEAFLKGIYMERRWKKENGVEMPIVWQAVPGLGFVLVCSKTDNYVQAHNVLDVIIQHLEKHLQFLTNPVMAMTIVETVALIVNQFLPGGQLLFMNSRLARRTWRTWFQDSLTEGFCLQELHMSQKSCRGFNKQTVVRLGSKAVKNNITRGVRPAPWIVSRHGSVGKSSQRAELRGPGFDPRTVRKCVTYRASADVDTTEHRPASCTPAVPDFLNLANPERWVGRGGPIEWPIRCPDLMLPVYSGMPFTRHRWKIQKHF
ncbi:hypothetical protein ANN_18494 [Periplaneta americana]|uniref:Uncharacterized protein n=1 Tax=Periplaneta americana TaxID=6978 RepID=A0ABQ8SPX6_PERAM|nr:hypothetical protein ANN_18494 [Periplaneta americana]